MNIGAPEFLIVVFAAGLPLVCLGLTVWALVDASARPDAAWQQAGQTRTTWIVLLAVGIVFCLLGLVVAIIYLTTIRPQLMGPPPPADAV
jgi:F0F1-type ATP synthase membrane subunit c/vacuolar-type H+-ATPase subunit K